MEPRLDRGRGWVAFSSVVLLIGGIFAAIDGLMAVYRSSFFATDAVFAFSDLRTWGWIVFGLGVAGIVSGLAVLTGREWSRWLGVGVAAASALGQLLFAQAYPLWSLMIMAIDFLVIYGLVVYGASGRVSAASRRDESPASGERGTLSDVSRRTDRAA